MHYSMDGTNLNFKYEGPSSHYSVYLTTMKTTKTTRKSDEQYRQRIPASFDHFKTLRSQWKWSCENSLKGNLLLMYTKYNLCWCYVTVWQHPPNALNLTFIIFVLVVIQWKMIFYQITFENILTRTCVKMLVIYVNNNFKKWEWCDNRIGNRLKVFALFSHF